MKLEILPLIIIGKLDSYDVQGVVAVVLFMLMISFVILFAINALQWLLTKRWAGYTHDYVCQFPYQQQAATREPMALCWALIGIAGVVYDGDARDSVGCGVL